MDRDLTGLPYLHAMLTIRVKFAWLAYVKMIPFLTWPVCRLR